MDNDLSFFQLQRLTSCNSYKCYITMLANIFLQYLWAMLQLMTIMPNAHQLFYTKSYHPNIPYFYKRRVIENLQKYFLSLFFHN